MEKKTKIHSLQAIRTDSRDKHINIIPLFFFFFDTHTLISQTAERRPVKSTSGPTGNIHLDIKPTLP